MRMLGLQTEEQILLLQQNKFYLIVLFLIFGSLLSCGLTVPRPKLEMSFAATALIAAKDAKAQKYSPAYYRKAEYYYLKAKSSYKKNFSIKQNLTPSCQKNSQKKQSLFLLKRNF